MNNQTVFALGFFDGVHMGHQALLSACRSMADKLGCQAGVVTFVGHPDTLVLGTTPPLINTREDRKMLLEQYHMDKVVELPFDKSMMTMDWQDFFTMLLQDYSAAGLVCGHDFRFGFLGHGTAQGLNELCEKRQLPCTVIPEQRMGGITLSSTYIRELIRQGLMETACQFLGHPHILTGTVISGRQIGRTLGIPTANLALPDDVVQPRFGVYACKVNIEGKDYLAVTNVGTRPTVDGHRITVEPWILDFEGDLYGKTLTLRFYTFLRPEQKFPGLPELKAEIRKNADQVRKFFGES